MFQRKKKRKRKEKGTAAAWDPDSDSDSDSDDDDDDGAAGPCDSDPKAVYAKDFVKEPNDGKEWGKNVDLVMRQYITTKLCRRDVVDSYFNNPARKRK
jgi:hypothetical protein